MLRAARKACQDLILRIHADAGPCGVANMESAPELVLLAEQARRRAEWAAVRVAAVSTDVCRAHAARARELLRRSPTAARIIDRRAAG
jgi:hypothetical protein